MKLLISNQHGAIVMALMPFLYGVLQSQFVWQHLFLLLAWSCLYLMTYPLFNLVKGKRQSIYVQWTVIYGLASSIFALPALWYQWRVIYFVLAMLPFVMIAIYYAYQKNERALLNDLAGIGIFALAGMAAYYFPQQQMDSKIWQVAIYPSLFFIGTTFYIKSMMRERKNPRYFWYSVIFHLSCLLYFALAQQYLLAANFVVPLVRAAYLPYKKLSIKQIGLLEFGISALFFIGLLYSTL